MRHTNIDRTNVDKTLVRCVAFTAIVTLSLLGCGEGEQPTPPPTPAKRDTLSKEFEPIPEVATTPSPIQKKLAAITETRDDLTARITALESQRDGIESPYRDETDEQRKQAGNRLAKLETVIVPLQTEHAANVKQMNTLESQQYNTRKTETGRTVRTLNVKIRKKRIALRKRRLDIEQELRPLTPEFDRLLADSIGRAAFQKQIEIIDQQIIELRSQINAIDVEIAALQQP